MENIAIGSNDAGVGLLLRDSDIKKSPIAFVVKTRAVETFTALVF